MSTPVGVATTSPRLTQRNAALGTDSSIHGVCPLCPTDRMRWRTLTHRTIDHVWVCADCSHLTSASSDSSTSGSQHDR